MSWIPIPPVVSSSASEEAVKSPPKVTIPTSLPPPVSAHMPNSSAYESHVDLFEDYKKPHLQSILDRSSELLLIGNPTLKVLANSSVILCYRVGVCGGDPTHCW